MQATSNWSFNKNLKRFDHSIELLRRLPPNTHIFGGQRVNNFIFYIINFLTKEDRMVQTF